MLRLSDQLFNDLGLVEYERFVGEMIEHARSIAPEAYLIIGEDGFEVLVRATLDRASDHGLTLRGALRLYLELRLMFGHGLDDDPQTPWVWDILTRNDETGPHAELHQVELLHMKAEQYVAKVHGKKDVHVKDALTRLDDFSKAAPDRQFEGTAAEAIHYARHIHPQKLEFVGEKALELIVARARSEAKQANMETGRMVTLLTLMMMSFGHRCTTDPLYPWIGSSLAMHQDLSMDERCSRFERRATTWMKQVRKTQNAKTQEAPQ